MDEFEVIVKNIDLKKVTDNPFREIVVKKKTVEQLRQEIISDIFRAITKETDRSVSFVEKADYVRAKFCDYKIEGLHKALSIMLEVSTIEVKER